LNVEWTVATHPTYLAYRSYPDRPGELGASGRSDGCLLRCDVLMMIERE